MHKQNERLAVNLHLHISPRTVLLFMALIVLTLTGISVASDLIRFHSGHRTTMTWWMAMFNLDREQNVSTFYQGISIFACVLALSAIALHKWRMGDITRFHWAGLAMIFMVLSLDEMCALHNQLEAVMSRGGKKEFHGVWHYSWVIPGLGFVAVVGLAYLWFLWKLPRRTAIGMMIAGAIYVGGAVGMEMVGGEAAERIGGATPEEVGQNLPCALLANLEEFMEMAGIAIFMYTLLNYKMEFVPHVSLQLGEGSAAADADAATAYVGPHHHLSGPARRAAGVHAPTRGSRRVGKIEVSVHVRPKGTRTDKFADVEETTQSP